jgi:replication factor A1
LLKHRAIVDRILEERSDLTPDAVEQMIKRKRDAVGGLLTEEGAAYIVASELGVDLKEEPLKTEINIRDLVPGVNDVSISGRVLLVYPVQLFTRQDETTGKVARLVIVDRTGMLDVVLWDDKTDLVSQGEIVQNRIIRFLHGYVREGLNGKPELNIGVRGNVIVNPQGVKSENFPEVKDFFKKIAEVSENDYHVNIIGCVRRIFPSTTFRKPTGQAGQVMRLQLADDTGRIVVVFWNEKVDEINEVKKEDYLQIMGGRVTKGFNGRLEIHVEKRSQITILTEKPLLPIPPPKLIKIADLKTDMSDVNVLARVLNVGPIREFKRKAGEIGRVATLIIRDETSNVRLSLWDDHAELVNKIKSGDTVLIEGAYTKESFGAIDLNLGRVGSLTLNPQITQAAILPQAEEVTMQIAQLKQGMTNVTIEGEVVNAPFVREVVTMKGETVPVASFTLRDQTGEIKASMWRHLSDSIKDLPVGSRIKIKNAYVKTGFAEELELSSRTLTTIEILSKTSATKPSSQLIIEGAEPQRKKIVSLREGEDVEVHAVITEVLQQPCIHLVCPKCLNKLEKLDENWSCDRCGVVTKPSVHLIVEVMLDDGTGVVNAVFFGRQAEEVLNMSIERAQEIVNQTRDENAPLRWMSKELIGREIIAIGKTAFNRTTNKMKLIVKEARLDTLLKT